ncbi:glucosaminidase domain-containing protein [Nanoarchaeota archaeon]
MLNGKRGILLKETLYLILGVLLIIAIFTAAFNTFNTIQTQKEKAQSLGSLQQLQNVLNGLETNWVDDYMALTPVGWWLVTYTDSNYCESEFCACICEFVECKDFEKRYCKQIKKQLIDLDTGANVKAKMISNLKVTDTGEKYEASVRSFKLGYGEYFSTKETYIDKYLEGREDSKLVGLGGCILNASRLYHVPAEFITAITIHETNEGKSQKSQEFCPNGPAKYSNNLFAVKGGTGTDPEGFCFWSGPECLTPEQASKASTIGRCDDIINCQEGTSCHTIPGQKYMAYSNRCHSIFDVAKRLSTNSRYKESIANFNGDFTKLARDIGIRRKVGDKVYGGYASDENVWPKKVAEYAVAISSFS